MRTFYDKPHAIAVYHAERRTIHCTWRKTASIEEYRDVFLHVLDKFKEYKALTYLSDIRHQGIVGTESRKWLESNIIPEAVKAGMKNIYVVTSEDAFKKFYLERVKNEVDKQSSIINTRYFTSEEEALDACSEPLASAV